MAKIPNFTENSAIVAASKVRHASGLGLDGGLQLGEGVSCCVRGNNASPVSMSDPLHNTVHLLDLRCQHIIGWVLMECPDCSVEEIYNILMFPVIGAIASDIESRSACRMFRELGCGQQLVA